jgi:hypothetical protein
VGNEFAYGSYTQLSGGQNTAFDPAGIEPDQYVLGVNTVSRGGVVRTRPPFTRVVQNFAVTTDEELFRNGRFQGGFRYSGPWGDYAVSVITGVLFAIDLATGVTYNLSSGETGQAFNPLAAKCWFCEAEGYLIIQDGTSDPVIMEGLSVRRSLPAEDEIPPGTVMAYGQGRLFVATGPGAVMAGDANDPTVPGSVLKFTETNDLNLGGYITAGSEIGDIRALFFMSNVDTSTGNGPLVIAGRSGMSSVRIDVPRAEWKNVVFRKFLVGEAGVTGSTALTPMNTDVMFWSDGGLRSLSVMLAEVTSARRFVNLSKEVAALYERDDRIDWDKCSMSVDRGRLLFTIGPRHMPVTRFGEPDGEDLGYDMLVSLDFDHLRGKALAGQYVSTVSYDGVWTGPVFLQLLGKDDETIFFAKDRAPDGFRNALYRIGGNREGWDDGAPVRSRLVTRSFVTEMGEDAAPAPFIRKQFLSTVLWPREVEGQVPVSVAVSVDDSPFFALVGARVLDAPVINWDETRLDLPEAGWPHSFPGFRFSSPEFICDPVTGGSLLTGYSFQFCIDWTGPMAWSRFLMTGTRDPKQSLESCDLNPRALVRADGRDAGTVQPFVGLDRFYRGDTGWYRRARRSFGPTEIYTGKSKWLLDRDCISFWKMNDDAADAIVVDTMGMNEGVANANTNTLTTTGKINGALNFLGSATVDFGGAENLQIKDRPTSWSFWVKNIDPVPDKLFFLGNRVAGTPNSGWSIIIKKHSSFPGVGDISFTNYKTDAQVSTWYASSTTPGAWMNIVIVRNGTAGNRIYVNNNAFPLHTNTENLETTWVGDEKVYLNLDPVEFEAYGGSPVDALMMFNRALTAEEVAIIYNDGNGREDF